MVIGGDKIVSGTITTSGITGTMAHVLEAPADQDGPVIITLTKTADNIWSVPAGAMLTDSQYQHFKIGNLYINVHSATHRGGDIRV